VFLHCPTPTTSTPRNQALAWGGGGLLVLYLANGLINQLDRLPLLPQALQLVGFAFSSWFFFRYVPSLAFMWLRFVYYGGTEYHKTSHDALAWCLSSFTGHTTPLQ
jgi:hypothetical protein